MCIDREIVHLRTDGKGVNGQTVNYMNYSDKLIACVNMPNEFLIVYHVVCLRSIVTCLLTRLMLLIISDFVLVVAARWRRFIIVALNLVGKVGDLLLMEM